MEICMLRNLCVSCQPDGPSIIFLQATLKQCSTYHTNNQRRAYVTPSFDSSVKNTNYISQELRFNGKPLKTMSPDVFT